MINNQFVYFPPNRKEYFFSTNLIEKGDSIFFYSPFNFFTKIFWYLLLNSKVFRSFFTCSLNALPPEIKTILKLIDSKQAAFQIKRGTEGPEQKTTLIKHSKESISFFKIGGTTKGTELIKNEFEVLKELDGKFNAPKIINFYSKQGFQIMETNYVVAHKVKSMQLNESVFLYILSIASNKMYSEGQYIYSFNHGDCCPWNFLQLDKGEVLLIDWELAGYYLLGYDLFTFIFQTPFLLTPNKSSRAILEDNMIWIKRFFVHFEINDIKQYLLGFVTTKLEYEISKDKNSHLSQKYFQLQKDLKNLQL